MDAPIATVAAIAEASRVRARTNRILIFVLGGIMFASLFIMAGLLQVQQNETEKVVHQQCLQRRANSIRSNEIWAALAQIEEQNPNKATREARLEVYRNARLTVPDCS